MAQQTPYPGPQYGVPPKRSRGPVVLVIVLGLVLVAVLATATVLILRGRDDKPTAAAGSKPAAADSVQFRPVLSAEPQACNGQSSGPQAEDTRCGADGTRYTLGKVELDGSRVSEVEAAQGQPGPNWVVQLTLDTDGAKLFGALTTKLAAGEPPRNQLAIVVGDKVVSAPVVNAPIIAGKVQIAGNFTQQDAEKLAADITG
jgi:preprotein translocase subunit SecD